MRRPVKLVVLFGLLTLVIAAATMPAWKPAAKRFKYFIIATNIYQDLLRRSGIRTDQIGQDDARVLPDSEIPTYLNRINTTFDVYQKYGELSPERIRGRRVLEVGPGETIGIALRFIAAGAETVTAVDKFAPLQTSVFHQRLYRALAAPLTDGERARIESAVELTGGVTARGDRLQYVYGEGVEDTARRLPPGSFDIIVSNAVLEEVYDTDRMFAGFDRLLAPGGRQVHVIDLGDYGMFSKHGFHPLEFLTVPDFLYRYMVESTGQPNRRALDYYRATADRYGYSARVFHTWVVGAPTHLPEYRTELVYGRDYSDENLELIRAVRPRLLSRYRNLPDEDLLTRSVLIVLDKPARTDLARRR